MWVCSATVEEDQPCGRRNFDSDVQCIACGAPQPGEGRADSGFNLLATHGEYRGQRFTLKAGINLVGRTEGDILLGDDQRVSRRHCTIEVPAGDVVLTDMGSTNGSFVGDDPAEAEMPVPLAAGDVLRLGGGTYVLEVAELGRTTSAAKDEDAGGATDTAGRVLSSAQQAGAQLLAGAQTAVELGRDKAQEYAPHVRAAAEKTRERAQAGAEQMRLATRTGIRPLFIVLFSVALLVICMILPLILAMPMLLVVNERHDEETQTSEAGLSQYTHIYGGAEYVATYIPLHMTDEIGLPALAATIIAGPIVMTGAGLQLAGSGFDENGMSGTASASLSLQDSSSWMWFMLGLFVLLVIADLLIGDQWAMQKLLAGLCLSWLIYAGILGTIAALALAGLTASMAQEGIRLYPSFSGVFEAPVRIALLGGVYWVASLLWRRMLRKPQPKAPGADD